MGGHGLYGSIGEYMKFIRMWLNDGAGPHGRVLKRETVESAVRNGLQAHQAVTMLPGVIPTLSNDAEFFPGLKKSWCLTFMVNDEDAPTGRPAGAIGWAGLANLFYWIDRKNGFGGYWATQILPFGDPTSFGRLPGFRDGRLCGRRGARGSVMPERARPNCATARAAFEIERERRRRERVLCDGAASMPAVRAGRRYA